MARARAFEAVAVDASWAEGGAAVCATVAVVANTRAPLALAVPAAVTGARVIAAVLATPPRRAHADASLAPAVPEIRVAPTRRAVDVARASVDDALGSKEAVVAAADTLHARRSPAAQHQLTRIHRAVRSAPATIAGALAAAVALASVAGALKPLNQRVSDGRCGAFVEAED